MLPLPRVFCGVKYRQVHWPTGQSWDTTLGKAWPHKEKGLIEVSRDSKKGWSLDQRPKEATAALLRAMGLLGEARN